MSFVGSCGVTCFGKVPSQGDFVRGDGAYVLIESLDRWSSSALELLAEDNRWKAYYDAALPIEFGLIGAEERVSLLGVWQPSCDLSHRRYPFIAVAALERDDSVAFRCAPALASGIYAQIGGLASLAVSGQDIGEIFEKARLIDAARLFERSRLEDHLGQFVRRTTLAALAEILARSTNDVRQIILAIGLLFQPIVGQTTINISKQLVLPLPGRDSPSYHLVAALWLYLVTAFFAQSSVELQYLIGVTRGKSSMLLGFNGQAAESLAAFVSQESAGGWVDLVDASWVETHPALSSQFGVSKLASYLEQNDLSLEVIINCYREVFLGE